MTADIDLTIAEVRCVQAIPYTWPAPPDAESCRKANAGSCASKHALLAEELDGIGLPSLPLFVVGSLVPLNLRADPKFADTAHLFEVHECLTVMTPWSGPLRVDVTKGPAPHRARRPPRHPQLGRPIRHAPRRRRGRSLLVRPPEDLRQAKEALRTRIYTPGQRELRDRILAQLVHYFDEIRSKFGQI